MDFPEPGARNPRTYPDRPAVRRQAEAMTATCDYEVPVTGEDLRHVIRAAVHATPELRITALHADEARIIQRRFGQFGHVWIGLDLTPAGEDARLIAARSKSVMDLSGGVTPLAALMDNIRTEVSRANA